MHGTMTYSLKGKTKQTALEYWQTQLKQVEELMLNDVVNHKKHQINYLRILMEIEKIELNGK